MAKYVTVSTLGPRPVAVNSNSKPEDIIARMKEHWSRELAQVLPDKPDIIVLPEACDRPCAFTMDKRLEYYRVRGTQMLEFFSKKAKENYCYIAYSAAREMPDKTWRNTTQIIDKKGEVIGTYDKNHPTIGEMDNAHIMPGSEATIINCDFGKVGFVICFDLNFEAIRQQYEKLKPQLLLFSSMYHGGLMANYWAYSCQTYLVGAIAGLENYVISPVGEKLATNTNYFNYLTATVNLDYRVVHLDGNWDWVDTIKRKYGPKVKVRDPGFLGAVMLSSETDEFTIDDIIEEFGIEDFDGYMRRSLNHRDKYVVKEKGAFNK